MDKGSKKIRNVKQFELLVEIMEKNPAIAKGFGGFNMEKRDYKIAWNEYAVKLNSLGPPTRDGDGWLKVWSDYKNKIRKKMQHNKKELTATGGRENKLYHFSVLESSVIDSLCLEKVVEPHGKEFGLASSINIQGADDEAEIIEDHQQKENFNNDINLKLEIKEQQIKQLDEQTKILKNINYNLECNTQYKRKIYELKQKKFQVYEKYLNAKLKLRKEKNEAKLKLLNLKHEELELKRELINGLKDAMLSANYF